MKKNIVKTACCLSIFMLVWAGKSNAQALTSDSIKAQMLRDWERGKAYTVEYLNTMPADKYLFRAVDSIRSFAQQMLHLAQANIFLMSTATGYQTPAWLQSDLEHSATAANKDSVMYYVTASYDYCANAVKSVGTDKWGEKMKIFGMETTRWALIMKTFEHQTHHRGQTTIYIRLQGIKPPQERLF